MFVPGLGMDFQSGNRLPLQEVNDCGGSVDVGASRDGMVGADVQATPTTIAAGCLHPRSGNGPHRTNPFTGAGAIGGTRLRVKMGLAEVGVRIVIQTHHQPRGNRSRPLDTPPSRRHHRRVSAHINTMDACQGKDPTQGFNAGRVLITGTADQLGPATVMQCLQMA
jgi:hypothetical protein